MTNPSKGAIASGSQEAYDRHQQETGCMIILPPLGGCAGMEPVIMKFEYLTDAEVSTRLEIAHLGLGTLIPEDVDEYQPSMDELVEELEKYLKADEDVSNDLVSINMMSSLYGFCFVWACGYRWAKNPIGGPFVSDVVVSPDEHYYVTPVSCLVGFTTDGDPPLAKLLTDTLLGNLPEHNRSFAIHLGD